MTSIWHATLYKSDVWLLVPGYRTQQWSGRAAPPVSPPAISHYAEYFISDRSLTSAKILGKADGLLFIKWLFCHWDTCPVPSVQESVLHMSQSKQPPPYSPYLTAVQLQIPFLLRDTRGGMFLWSLTSVHKKQIENLGFKTNAVCVPLISISFFFFIFIDVCPIKTEQVEWKKSCLFFFKEKLRASAEVVTDQEWFNFLKRLLLSNWNKVTLYYKHREWTHFPCVSGG